MATKIRLARLGRKKQPFYRIMVSDNRAPRDGRHIDLVGYVNPLQSPREVRLDREKAIFWLNKGAIPTQTVHSIFSHEGILLEWDLRKSGMSEENIKTELQKFALLQELKKKNIERKQETVKKAELTDTEKKEEQEEKSPAGSGEKAESAQE